ncbi:hypothetical protein OG241_45275 [Streptomyces sp. NBC_01390]
MNVGLNSLPDEIRRLGQVGQVRRLDHRFLALGDAITARGGFCQA